MTAISWLDEQILALDQIVDRISETDEIRAWGALGSALGYPVERYWICAAISSETHPYRITDGIRDLGHYATLENAQRALAEMA